MQTAWSDQEKDLQYVCKKLKITLHAAAVAMAHGGILGRKW
jgi:hypothetical protein